MEIPGVKALIDQAFEKLTQRTGRYPQCPFCSHNDWARLGGRRVILIPTIVEENPTSEPVPQTALGFVCTHCGFLRIHAVDPASWGLPGNVP
jgi:hypothetical protein